MIHNFSAGPGVLPQKVLEKVKSELLSFNNCGVSVLELSHRSKEFKAIISNAERDFRKLLSIPDNYKVLFMQGGASTQFSAVLYNLVVDDKPIDYIITGQWSCKAYKEAVRMGCNAHVSFNISQGPFDATKLSFSTNPQFIYYCDNETVDGFELPVNVVDSFPNSTIVCDMSSNFMSRKFDVSRYGVIFGGAQKNIGPAGVTIVIVREDLLGLFEKSPLSGPLMLDYKLCADNGSLYNTPPTFSIYVSGLVFDHVLSLGGLQYMAQYNKEKSQMIYSTLQNYPTVFLCPVPVAFRSRMNVVFRILKNGQPDSELEKIFCSEAERKSMICLAGHRSVGGIRASIYNSLPIESIQFFRDFLIEFAKSQ